MDVLKELLLMLPPGRGVDTALDISKGVSYIVSKGSYEKFISQNMKPYLGRGMHLNKDVMSFLETTLFVSPKEATDEAIKKALDSTMPDGIDHRKLEELLSVGEGNLGDDTLYRIDIDKPDRFTPTIPTKETAGSNDWFVEGGKTMGGVDEMVVHNVPTPDNDPDFINAYPLDYREEAMLLDAGETDGDIEIEVETTETVETEVEEKTEVTEETKEEKAETVSEESGDGEAEVRETSVEETAQTQETTVQETTVETTEKQTESKMTVTYHRSSEGMPNIAFSNPFSLDDMIWNTLEASSSQMPNEASDSLTDRQEGSQRPDVPDGRRTSDGRIKNDNNGMNR